MVVYGPVRLLVRPEQGRFEFDYENDGVVYTELGDIWKWGENGGDWSGYNLQKNKRSMIKMGKTMFYGMFWSRWQTGKIDNRLSAPYTFENFGKNAQKSKECESLTTYEKTLMNF